MRILIATVALCFLSSCSLLIDPKSLQVGETTESRPETKIGPAAYSNGGVWRVLTVNLERRDIAAVRRAQTTFGFRLTNCSDREFQGEDIYVDGNSLWQLSSLMSEAEFKKFYEGLSPNVRGYIYIREALYASEPKICGQFFGGSYLGQTVKSKTFPIK